MQKDIYPIASLENTEAVNLEKAFYNIDGVNIVDKSAAMQIPDYANNNGIPSNNSQVTETSMSQRLYRLNGNVPGSKMGLGITLKVMAGDQVDIMAKSYWKTADGNVTGTPSAIDLEGLLTNFVGNGIANKQGITGPLLNSAGGITSMLNELLNGQSQTSTRPKAYLNWILFDENFRPVIGGGHTNSGFDAVGNNDDLDNSGELKTHGKSTGEITKNGYLYIYCSNESRLDVFFDNLQVVHTRGALLEETHYYPFGLTMAGISSKAAGIQENKDQKFQGQKFDDDLGLNWYQFKWRNHDPQIGRFIEIDPLSEKYVYNSSYAFSENHVTSHIELEGLEKLSIHDPNIVSYPSRDGSPVLVSKKLLDEGKYRKSTKPEVVSEQWGIKRPKGTAALEVRAGGAVEVKGLGFSGGKGVTVIGVEDNDLVVGGKNLNTGKVNLTNSAGGAFLGFGGEWESTEEKTENGKYVKTNEKTTARVGFIFTEVEEKDFKTGEKTQTYNINWGAAIGIGLVLNAEFTIPFYTKVTKL